MAYPPRSHRYQTHIPVQVSRPGGPQVAYIVDISESGACVVGLQGISVGDAVVLRSADNTNVATIRWAANSRVGVTFDRPIPPKYLNIMRYRDPLMQRPIAEDIRPN